MSRPSVKQVYIRSRRPHHPALRCYDRVVLADQFENATNDECWTLENLGNDTYYIIYRGDYLQASPNGEVSCPPDGEWLRESNRSHPNDKWKIEYTRNGYVSIKSYFNKYLCADENFRVTANRECCELWEQWAIVDKPHLLVTPTREVYIRCCQQQLFHNNDDGLPALDSSSFEVAANCYGPATDSEKWHIVCFDDNKIFLEANDGFLYTYENGTVAITHYEKQPWTVENVEGTSIPTVALKSIFGGYLCRDNGDHIMCDGSVKADSTDCRDKRSHWVFLTDPSDINGNMALTKDAIIMKDYVDEYA